MIRRGLRSPGGRGGAPQADRDQAWLDFAGWRVNYDTVFLALCSITMAPPAAWSSDPRRPSACRQSSRKDP